MCRDSLIYAMHKYHIFACVRDRFQYIGSNGKIDEIREISFGDIFETRLLFIWKRLSWLNKTNFQRILDAFFDAFYFGLIMEHALVSRKE